MAQFFKNPALVACIVVLVLILTFAFFANRNGIDGPIPDTKPDTKEVNLPDSFDDPNVVKSLNAGLPADSQASTPLSDMMNDEKYEKGAAETEPFAATVFGKGTEKYKEFLTSGYILNRGYAIPPIPVFNGEYNAYLHPSRVLWDRNQGIVNGYTCESLRANPPAHQAVPLIKFEEFERSFKKPRELGPKEAEQAGIPQSESSSWRLIPITLHLSTPELREELLRGLAQRMNCNESNLSEPILLPLAEAKILLEAPSFKGQRFVDIPIDHGLQPVQFTVGLPVRLSDIEGKTARSFSESIRVALVQSRWGFFAKYDFSSLSMKALASLSNEEIRHIISSSAESSVRSDSSAVDAGITAKIESVVLGAGGQKASQSTVSETKPIAVTGDELRTIVGRIVSDASAYSSVEISSPKDTNGLFSSFKVSESENFLNDPKTLADWLDSNSRPDLASILREPATSGGESSVTPPTVSGEVKEDKEGEVGAEGVTAKGKTSSSGKSTITGGSSSGSVESTSPPMSQDLFLLNTTARQELLNRSATAVALTKMRVPSRELHALVIKEIRPQVNEARSASSFTLRAFGSSTDANDSQVKSGERFIHKPNGQPDGQGDTKGKILVKVEAALVSKEEKKHIDVTTTVTVEGVHIYEVISNRSIAVPANTIGLGTDQKNPKDRIKLEWHSDYAAPAVGEAMGDNPHKEAFEKDQNGIRVFNSFVSPFVSHKHTYRAKTGPSWKPRWVTRCCKDYDNTARSIEARLNIEVGYVVRVSPETTVFTRFQLPTPSKVMN